MSGAHVWSTRGPTPPSRAKTRADQFFDEAQWESYRRLGYHVGREVGDLVNTRGVVA